jgi:aerobic-type carbon monoxide dehydrogenase small subunit (CoxS/CutS family)
MDDEFVDVALTVNGRRHEVRCEARTLLSDLLRDELGCKEVRVGCEHGVCGACTIMVDGAAIRSCIMLAGCADGAEITTIAGLVADGEQLPPLHRAFSEEHGFQCGFCTGGILISVLAEVRAGRSKEEVTTDALGGHICRCTGYVNIRRAIDAAWDELERSEAPA